MRLHSLSLSAFGSFGGTETVDFDQLSDPGIFLLHGPTGAGKTTILDAISFALFARVPGIRSSGESLRSDFAPPSVATEVRLEVSLGGRRYRIVRRPKQLRAKTRGEGFREHLASATVQELVAGSWVARGARPSEVDPFLAEQLHMGADQFHQLVMLPQGEFATFLRANADDRRQVLEQLFGTHRFAEVERWLRTRADEAGTAVHDADVRIRRTLAVAAATMADTQPFADDRALGEASAWLTELQAHADEQAGAAATIDAAAGAAHQQASAALAEATTVADRQRRHGEAAAAHQRLTASDDEQATRRVQLDAARRAASVVPLADQAARATRALDGAEQTVAARRQALAGVDPHLADADRPALDRRIDELATDLGRVDDLVDDERELDDRAHRVETLDEQIRGLEAALVPLRDERDGVPGARRTATRQLRQAEKGADRVPDLERQAALLADRRRAAVERDRLVTAVDQHDRVVTDLTRAELDARARWLDQREAHLQSRAALLAADLVEGEPCPVCGSAEHPIPAVGDGPVVTDDELLDAEAGADRTARATQQAKEARAGLEQQLAVVTAAAAGLATDEITEQQTALDLTLAEARAAASRCDELHQQLDRIEGRAGEIDHQITLAEPVILDAREQRAALDHGLTAMRGRVTAARAGFPTLARRRAALAAEHGAARDLLAALQSLDAAAVACAGADEAATAESGARGFDDVVQARAAALDDAAVAQLDEAIVAHDVALAETSADLKRAELVAAAALAPVDLAPLRLANDQAQRDRDLASLVDATARKAVADLTRLASEVGDELTRLAPAIETAERTRHLADLASGDDRQVANRMRLSTYVLSARLEQVAAAASERLSRMSDGQFTIVPTDEAADGRRKGGLGLRIADAWTGTVRETSTLSGGQSFFASLALALGVADVVSAEVGGARIDTMFIDEGFGSLDDDTLETVMDVLDGLRAGGRAIGIVSHVADLRTRIPSQLEVVKTAQGSHLQGAAAHAAGESSPDAPRRAISAA